MVAEAAGIGDGKIAFIGLGIMGAPMALHLARAGYRLAVYTRTRREERLAPLRAAGAEVAGSAAEAARDARLAITMVGYPADVEALYLGPDGLVGAMQPGSYLADMTTSSPELARRIHAAAKARGLRAADAPVSGGEAGAKDAKLSVMVGAEERDFGALLPVFKVLGQSIVHHGPPGAGQTAKLANQIAIAGAMLGACEALAFARRAGLDGDKVLQSLGAGAAASASLEKLGPRMLRGDFAPGFYVRHFLKDMGLAREEAHRLGLAAPGLEAARRQYERLASLGGSDQGTQALYRLYAGAPAANHQEKR